MAATHARTGEKSDSSRQFPIYPYPSCSCHTAHKQRARLWRAAQSGVPLHHCRHRRPSHDFLSLGIALSDAFSVLEQAGKPSLSLGKSLVRGLPVPFSSLGIIELYALSLGVHQAKLILCSGDAKNGSFQVPLGRLRVFLFDSVAIEVPVAKLKLRLGIALISRLPVPLNSLVFIRADTAALKIPLAQLKLRLGISFLGSLPIPYLASQPNSTFALAGLQ